jgi:outer membrane protein TolC
VKQARASLESSVANLENARLSVLSDVAQAYLNLRTAEQRLVTAISEVANAEESMRLNTGRYRAGLNTILDVLDAENAVLTAETNRVNARSAVDQARAALARAVGLALEPSPRLPGRIEAQGPAPAPTPEAPKPSPQASPGPAPAASPASAPPAR